MEKSRPNGVRLLCYRSNEIQWSHLYEVCRRDQLKNCIKLQERLTKVHFNLVCFYNQESPCKRLEVRLAQNQQALHYFKNWEKDAAKVTQNLTKLNKENVFYLINLDLTYL